MIFSLLQLAIGLVILIVGGELLIRGAVSLATRYGIPPLVVGLTAVAFGTSAPELAVGVLAAFQGKGDIALGNVVGSNIANIALLLGLTAVIRPIPIDGVVVTREIPMMLLATTATLVLALDSFFGTERDIISRGDAIILFMLFAVFLYYTIAEVIQSREEPKGILEEVAEIQEAAASLSVVRAALYMFVGIVGLAGGGYMTVESAVSIARSLGVPEIVIGVTLVAVGTSLPELVTSIQASIKGMSDLIVGNIVGSNIFNLLLILSSASAVSPISLPSDGWEDMVAMLVVSVLLFMMVCTRKRSLGRFSGLAFLGIYLVYMLIQVQRGMAGGV